MNEDEMEDKLSPSLENARAAIENCFTIAEDSSEEQCEELEKYIKEQIRMMV